MGQAEDRHAAFDPALYLAERAISLAPQLAEPWIAIAMLRLDDIYIHSFDDVIDFYGV